MVERIERRKAETEKFRIKQARKIREKEREAEKEKKKLDAAIFRLGVSIESELAETGDLGYLERLQDLIQYDDTDLEGMREKDVRTCMRNRVSAPKAMKMYLKMRDSRFDRSINLETGDASSRMTTKFSRCFRGTMGHKD